MRMLTRAEQKEYMKRMIEGHREVERLRMEALRNKPYDPAEVDTLLQLAEYYDGPPRLTSGLVEMQAIFMTAHDRLRRREK